MLEAINPSTYLKENNPEIDICLNCTKEKCTGNCELMKKEVVKEYIVKRLYVTAKNELKVSYISHAGGVRKPVTSSANIFKAQTRTYEGAELLLEQVKRRCKAGTHFEIVKRSEELERISKDKHKQIKKRDYILVDCNGNRLGCRNAVAGV